MKPDFGKLAGTILVGGYLLNAALKPTANHFIDGANLMFHEAGHLIFSFCPEIVAIMAGSGFQTALPLGIVAYVVFKHQYFTAAVVMMWVGQTMTNTSVYAGDALTMQLELIGGENTIHDWNHILWHFGLLRHTDTIATVIRVGGTALIVGGLILSLYLSFDWKKKKS
ncbi:MAG: hypothetical protein U9Q03_00355 [Patescibacteria group bacterium]|nr:hypothetical protein [Patescibacteria group bacterium]